MKSEEQFQADVEGIIASGLERAEAAARRSTRSQEPKNPRTTKQDYGTPMAFIEAVERRFGGLSCDLAATHRNAKALVYLGPGHEREEMRDSLAFDWSTLDGNLWLNPPFQNFRPWAQKACERTHDRRWTHFLCLASVGSTWFRMYVHGVALVQPLAPRLVFEGEKDPYPKELMLCTYGFGVSGFQPWVWM